MPPNDPMTGEMSDYEKLTDRELDAVIAEKVMGWSGVASRYAPEEPTGRLPGKLTYHLVPRYSTDDNAIRLVRDRIAELGQDAMESFMGALFDRTNARMDMGWWAVIHATPRQQCVAALLALDGKQ